MKYELCVGALFKNEAHILEEWIEHYLYHGVEHIYLINDRSTDHYMEILQPYIDSGNVTLFEAEEGDYRGRQRVMYNTFLLPLLNEKVMQWLIMCDLDEFVWSARDVDLRNVLRLCKRYSQIQIDSNCFGSNGHEEQPKYVVPSFTKRAKLMETGFRNFKYIVNSDFAFSSLNVHHANYVNPEEDHDTTKFVRIDYIMDREMPYFVLNHYITQSKEFWLKIKCTRGDSDSFTRKNETIFHEFNEYMNDEEDLRLYQQNQHLYQNLDKNN